MQGRIIDGPGRYRDLLHRVPLTRRAFIRSLDPLLLALVLGPRYRREETHEPVDVVHRLRGQSRHVAPGSFVLRRPEGLGGLVQKLVVVAEQKPDPVVGFR